VGKGDVDDLGAEIAAAVDGGLRQGADVVGEAVGEVFGGDAEAEAAQVAGVGDEVADGLDGAGGSGGIVRVLPGDELVDPGGILDGAGDGADLVERRGEGDAAVAGDAAVGGLEAGDAAEGGRLADGPAGVRGQGGGGQPGGDGRGGPAGGAARDAVDVPRVVGRAVGGGFGAAAHGEFVGVRAGDEDDAGIAEAGDDGGVVGRDIALEDARRGGAGLALDVQEVLDGHWHAEERTGIAGGTGGIGGGGLGEGVVGVAPSQGVEARFEGVGARQEGFGQLDARDGAGAEGLGGGGQVELVQRDGQGGGFVGHGVGSGAIR